MRKFSIVVMALLLSLCLVSVGAASDKTDWPDHLRFMAGPPGGNWFALGGSLADMWSKNVLQTTSGTGGGVSNIVNVDRAKGDFGTLRGFGARSRPEGGGSFQKAHGWSGELRQSLPAVHLFHHAQGLCGEARNYHPGRHRGEEASHPDGYLEARHSLGVRHPLHLRKGMGHRLGRCQELGGLRGVLLLRRRLQPSGG